jgi:hypothetical protein
MKNLLPYFDLDLLICNHIQLNIKESPNYYPSQTIVYVLIQYLLFSLLHNSPMENLLFLF